MSIAISGKDSVSSITANQETGDREAYIRTLEQKLVERTHELEVKHAELGATLAQLEAAQQQLLTQEKLVSLGSLMAGIAHEIKNPLNFIINFAELSKSLVSDLEETLETCGAAPTKDTVEEIEDTLDILGQNVQKIAEHGARANNIVNGMLLNSRGAPPEYEKFDFNNVIAEGIDLGYHGYRGKAPGFNVTIDAKYEDGLGSAEIAAQDIVRVLINVINNACYAMHEKQRTAGSGYTPTLVVRTRGDANEVCVSIRDNGTGIPEGIIAKVWNPFFTTKPPGEGTGLGLSISYDAVVQGHRGSMHLATEAGAFTEFVITLPRRQDPSMSAAEASSMFDTKNRQD